MAVVGGMATKPPKIPTAAQAVKQATTPQQPDITSIVNQALAQQQQAWQQQQQTQQQAQQNEAMNYIKQLEQAQASQNIANIDRSYNDYMATINADKAKVQPQAYADRNVANVNMNNANRSWDEFLASKGLTSSGVAATGYTNNLNNYQGQVGAINRNATNRINELDNQAALAQKNRSADIAAAQAGASAQALQNQLNQYNANRDFAYQQSRDKVADDRYNTNLERQNYIDTIGQFSNDYMAEINKVKNDGNAANDWQIGLLQTARNEKIANQQALEAKAAEARTAAQQQQFENALAAWKASGVASSAISQILGVPVGAKTADYNISSINAATSRQNANTSARNASTSASRLEYDKKQDQQKLSNQTYNNYLNMGNDMKNAGSDYQGVFTPRYTPDQIRDWIIGLPVDSATAARLLSDLGV